MIPSDHFVRFYNEVFKTLDEAGRECLVEYWRDLGRLQVAELAESFRNGGLRAAFLYWSRIIREENCDAEIVERDDHIEIVMRRCPSLSKVLDNDAMPFDRYCDHCMAWIEPVMNASGLYAVMDMISRRKPCCVFRIFRDRKAAAPYERRARLLSKPYGDVRPPSPQNPPDRAEGSVS